MTDGAIQVRVWVPDVWDHVVLDAAPDETIGQIKERSLAEATRAPFDPAAYEGVLIPFLVRVAAEPED